MKNLFIIGSLLLALIFGLLYFKNLNNIKTKIIEKTVYKPVTDSFYNKIVFYQVKNAGLIFIPVEINGKRVWMLVDTGAGQTVVDLGRSGRLNMLIEENPYVLNGIGGQIEAYDVINTKKIKLGKKEYNINIQASDLSKLTYIFSSALQENVIGILGSDFLEENGFVIDYSHNIIYSSK